MPSSSGMPAATIAPKAISRTASVTGSDVHSARRKSELIASQIALFALASPNCSMRTVGCARCAAAAAATAALTLSRACCSSPATRNVTSAERPSRESVPAGPGATRSRTCGVTRSRATTSRVASLNAGSVARTLPRPCTRTCSCEAFGKSAASYARNARPDSPLPISGTVR